MALYDINSYPVGEIVPEFKRILSEGTRCVLSAPPGAGKTTVLPLEIMNDDWLEGRKILILEPRRLAAYTAAWRMAENLGKEPGKTIGYRMRLENCVGPNNRIEVVTEGILTRFIQNDPELNEYGCIIFDEFHERSLQADTGLALALDIQEALRPDLRIVVMSATVDCEAVAEMLDNCPVVESRGRSFEVSTVYRQRNTERRLEELVEDTVMHALEHESGSMLVFLPGEGAIRNVESVLRKRLENTSVEIHPLYGRLSTEEQHAAIAPVAPGSRKIVLATSIAETSLTIDGIRIVVDSGLTRMVNYNPVTDMSRLETVKISQASADQRRGRAGRLEPGVCYRLWTEDEHGKMSAFTPPEIANADLAPLALELAQWGVTSPGELKWLDPPEPLPWKHATNLLKELDAIDEAGKITAFGRRLTRTGLHPRLAVMIEKGIELNCGRLACEIAAVITECDARKLDSPDLTDAVDGLRRRFRGFDRAIRFCDNLCRRLKINPDKSSLKHIGLLLAFAWPDRIARQREKGSRNYLMSCGRGAQFYNHNSLTNNEFIVTAEVDSGDKNAAIYLAASLERADIDKYFRSHFCRETAVIVDSQTLRFEERTYLGKLILESKKIGKPDPEHITEAILGFIRDSGIDVLNWTQDAEELRNRLAFLNANDPAHKWPDVSDEALAENLTDWLGPFIDPSAGKNFLKAIDLTKVLQSMVPWDILSLLDKLAPERISVPSGSKVKLDYSGNPPILAVRLQEMFGCIDTPTVLDGKVKVLLHLLSPARRPVQITADLNSFWNESYKYVKSEMKGRYPKHYWPDNPLEAEATARAKPRK